MKPHTTELIRLIQHTQSEKVCEVGVWKGETSFNVLKSCNSIKQYFMVDPLCYEANNFYYDSSNEDFPKMMSNNKYICSMGEIPKTKQQLDQIFNDISKKLENIRIESQSPLKGLNDVVFYREDSLKAVERFDDDELDLVFIDAIHLYEEVKKDISAWMLKVKNGGVLCGDDYVQQFPGVIRAVDEIFGDKKIVKGGVWSVVLVKEENSTL
tara:strand:- start:1958 stop:2590 length:633 start_codon:yes stop_codon:yes gene_type:complete